MRLAYADEGPGRAVVLLHGFPLSHEMWSPQLTALGSTYRLIAPDLRGHGISPAPEGVYTMDEMADDVIELLNLLHIDERVVLGGLSMGGYVALAIWARHPERIRALILMDTRAGADTIEAAAGREASADSVLKAGNAHQFVTGMLPRLFTSMTLEQRPERVEPLRAVMDRTEPLGIAGALRGMAKRPDRRDLLPTISVPTLVMVGEHDVITPPAEARLMAEAIPGSQFALIPDAGHMAPYENAAAANEVLLQFLNSLEAGR
jgi:pimeloyl-ACP methyl ester carboxylesterase